jgi:predicted nucleic acid-binding protein
MIVVDTTILVYALGSHHPLREPCRGLIRQVTEGRVRATTTTEVIQEFTHVRGRRRSRGDAIVHARDYIELFTPLLSIDEARLIDGLEIHAAVERLGAFDAVLASAARAHGAHGLASADVAFGDVDGLPHLDPASNDFLARTLAG